MYGQLLLFELNFDILLQIFINLDSSVLIWIPQCHFDRIQAILLSLHAVLLFLRAIFLFLKAILLFLSAVLVFLQAILHSFQIGTITYADTKPQHGF